MPKHAPSTATPEDILVGHTPQVRALVEQLRSIIKQTVPSAIESARPGWHCLSYHHPNSGYFCAIFPHADRVDLAFEFGALLTEIDNQLEGTGNQLRYLHIMRPADIRPRVLKKLLIAAIDLPTSRAAKLDMIRAKAKIIQ